MLFQNENASLQLDVVNYELPAGAWAPGSDDCNWLVLRCTWHNENGDLIKDSNSCLMTYELQEMTAGLKVLHAGIRSSYESSFLEPYFLLAAAAEEDGYRVQVSFFLPNTMDGDDTAEVSCHMSSQEMGDLIAELDKLCAKFPDRQ